VFKTFRYSKNITIIINVFKKQKDSLIVVGTLAIGYIIVSALIVFNVEPDTFPTFLARKPLPAPVLVENSIDIQQFFFRRCIPE
jgi:hypothetical protein